jgi:hypothetical protein
MIGIWIKIHSVSDNQWQHNDKIYNAQMSLQEMTNNLRFTLSVADTTHVVYN